jgi:hypothetical protein
MKEEPKMPERKPGRPASPLHPAFPVEESGLCRTPRDSSDRWAK